MIKYYPATNVHFIVVGGFHIGGDSDSRRKSGVCTGDFLFESGCGSGGGEVRFIDGVVEGSGSGSG